MQLLLPLLIWTNLVINGHWKQAALEGQPFSHISLFNIAYLKRPEFRERGAGGHRFFHSREWEKIHQYVFSVCLTWDIYNSNLNCPKHVVPRGLVRVLICFFFFFIPHFPHSLPLYFQWEGKLVTSEYFETNCACYTIVLPHTATPWQSFKTRPYCASYIPGSTRSPQTYSISLDYRPAEVKALTEELHCYVWCQIRSQWEETEPVLVCVPGWGSDWTHSCTAGSYRILAWAEP